MKRNQITPLAILIFLCVEVTAQETIATQTEQSKKFETIGGLMGWGNSFSKNTFYQVYYFILDYSKSFNVPKKKDFVGWYAEPQFNLVRSSYLPKGEIMHDFEFGLNLGIRNYVKISDGFYFYQMLGSGPHYISAPVKRQHSGFIFSDNFALGGLIRLPQENLMLNLQYVQRHISNANLMAPNGGINFYNFVLGVSRVR